jgi:hypothetical protein
MDAAFRVLSSQVDCNLSEIVDRIIHRFTTNGSKSMEDTMANISQLMLLLSEDVELIALNKQNSIGVQFVCTLLTDFNLSKECISTDGSRI